MFIVCNYLDVIHVDAIPDGFVVEECSVFDPSLDGYCVVCREHKIPLIMDWARINMDKFYAMFEKQFKTNKRKAMKFVASNGKIESYTSEFVASCGGLEQFKEVYCQQSNAPSQNDRVERVESFGVVENKQEAEISDKSDENVSHIDDESASTDTTEKITDTTIQENVQNIETNIQIESVQDSPVWDEFQNTESDVTVSDTVAQQMEEVWQLSTMESETKNTCESSVVAPVCNTYQSVTPVIMPNADVPKCHSACIYNSDGTFKGFSEGQIVAMLQTLRDLDKRIALDTLNPEYILDDEDVRQSSIYLETISPSVFKGFLLHMLEQTKTETDRIRASVLLDKFSTYLASLNKN